MSNGAAWNPVDEIRQKYPALKSWDDQRILANLQNPAKFRSAFPEYSHLDDQTIIRNMGKMTAAAAPKGFDEQHPILAGVENFFSNPLGGQWAQNKLAQAQQMEKSELNQAYGPEADIESQKFKQAAAKMGVPQPVQQIGDFATRAYHQGKSLAAAGAQIPYGLLSMTVPEAGLTVGSTMAGQPEIAGSYWATRGIVNATNSIPQAVQNPTPENIRGSLTDLSMISGGLGGVPERPVNAAVPTPFGIGRPAPPPVPQEAVPSGGIIQRAVRSAMGMGEKPMVKGAKAALKENAFEAGKVNTANAEAAAKTKLQNQQQAAEDYQARRLVEEQNEVARQETAKANQQAAADHAKEVARVEGMNEAGQAQVAKRASLQQKTLDDSAALVEAAQKKALAVRAEGKQMYEDVNNAVGPDAGIAAPEVAKLVKHAEDNILAGSRPESIKQFRMMLEEAKQTGGPNAAILDQTAQGLGYENASDAIQRIGPDQFQRYLPPDLQGAQAEPAIISFKDLGGYVTELGDLMYNRNVPNDVFAALRHVRNGIQDMRMEIAEDAGAGQMLEDANSFWRNYENVYNNSRNVTVASRGLGAERIGSPVARLIRTADAPIARNLLTGNISDRLIETLKREDPQLGAMAEQIRKDHAESASLPKRYQIKPTPEAPTPAKPKLKETPQYAEPKATPEPTPLPESPNLGQLTVEQRQARLDKTINALRNPNLQRYEAVTMVTGVLGQLFGFRPYGMGVATAAGTSLAAGPILARILESPKVSGWLTDLTPRDVSILNKLDPAAKSALQDAITQKMIEKHTAPSPTTRSFLSPSQSAAITAAIGAAYSTPQSIMLGMKMGQLSPTDGAAMLQKLRRSASAGPTRRLAQPETPPPPPVPQTY